MGTSHFFRIQVILALFGVGFAFRLPNSIVPTGYSLKILTNLGDEDGKFAFSGTVSINIECFTPTDNITMHAKKLTIPEDKASIKHNGNEEGGPSITGLSLVEEDDFVVIKLSEELKAGEHYTVELHFEAELEDVLAGYYRSYYIGENGEKAWLAVTQFEPYDARRAFPCFDEPMFKATFTITLGRSEKYTSISNMELEGSDDIEGKSGWKWDRYKVTPPMSTYLVAFAVTDFAYHTSEPSENFAHPVTFRIWARKSAINQTAYAQEVGPKILNFYENYFEFDYPLSKQDMIAVPDFSAGAMENWGLITFREKYLLFDPKESPTVEKVSIMDVVAHELAHQWFGNLVTMKWWTDLWLNEGFATYMSRVAVQNLSPEWNYMTEHTAMTIMSVFGFDALQSSHPVSVPINHPKEIEEIFDTISYRKGSFLLHMMSNFLGREVLRMGVSKYLHNYQYNNAEKDDLLLHLTAEAHRTRTLSPDLTVKRIMDGWVSQTGYPLVTVTRDYKRGFIHVSQERFFRDSTQSDHETRWWIPLTYTTECEMAFNSTEVKKWFSPEDDNVTIEIGVATVADWVIFNVEASALYRVNYDTDNWKHIIRYLKGPYFRQIPDLNRVLLLDSAAGLSANGKLAYDIFFELSEYLVQEMDYLPWRAAIRSLNDIECLIKRLGVYDEFVKFMRRLITPVYKQFGGFQMEEDERVEAIKHKIQITSVACKYGIEDCVSQAYEMFKILQTHEDDLGELGFANDLRETIYCYSVKNGTEHDWNYLWDQYTKSNVQIVKNGILNSLSCTTDHHLLQRYLEWSIDDTHIRKQDVVAVVNGVVMNKEGFLIAKEFLSKNMTALYNKVYPTVSHIGLILNVLARYTATQDEYVWLEDLITSNEEHFSGIKNKVKQALETAKVNVQWNTNSYGAVEEYFGMK